MSGEGPFRETPKREPFDSNKHEMTKHEDGPLAGKNTYVRKVVIESDKEAAEKVEARNLVFNWVDKLLGKKRETYKDVLHEEALIEYIHDARVVNVGTLQEGAFTFKKHSIYVLRNDKRYSAKVDKQKVSNKQAELLHKKFFPLLVQIEKNKKRTDTINNRLKKKYAAVNHIQHIQEERRREEKLEPLVNEILGKTMPALNEADEPKQLNQKKEE